MNAAQAGLYVDQLTVTWRNGHTALRDASFSVPRGSIAALVGVNGSGKSTLFKALMGFVRVGHGEIAILGQPVNRALRQNLVAYVPQSEEVDWSFPVLVEDVVMMGRYGHMGWLRRAKPRDREIVDTALARVGMSEYRHRQIGELSGGQKKRVFLARAIAQQGQVILLDELGGLDEVTALEQGLFSGVDFVATLHAATPEEATMRPQVKYLMERGAARVLVWLTGRQAPGCIGEGRLL